MFWPPPLEREGEDYRGMVMIVIVTFVMIIMITPRDDYDDKDCANISTAVPWTDLKAEVLGWTSLVPVHYVQFRALGFLSLLHVHSCNIK